MMPFSVSNFLLLKNLQRGLSLLTVGALNRVPILIPYLLIMLKVVGIYAHRQKRVTIVDMTDGGKIWPYFLF